MKKKSLFLFLLVLIFMLPIAFSITNSFNYVKNESCSGNNCWIPWLATIDGKPKIDMNLLNITTGNITVKTLTNCDTIDTDAQGLFTCGSDDGGGVSSDIFAGIEQNITDVRDSIDNNMSRALTNNSDANLFVVNVTVLNATTINATGISGLLDWAWLYAIPAYVRDYTDPINNNITKVRSEIVSNHTDLVARMQLNWTYTLTNLSAMNTSLGAKADRIEVVTTDVIDEVIAGLAANISELRANDTAQFTNISNMNTSLGAKADRDEIVTTAVIDEVIAGIVGNVSELRANDTAQFTNISAMNTTLGLKADRSEIIADDDGAYLQNLTDVTLIVINATTINATEYFIRDTTINTNLTAMNTSLGAKADRDEIVSITIISEVINGIIQNITDTRASIDNNITDLKAELSLNFTTMRSERDSNASTKIQNGTDVSLIFINATVVNATTINATWITAALDWAWLYAVPFYVRDYTNPINNNITKVRAEIVSNHSDLIVRMDLNWSYILTNLSDMNTSLGAKADRDEVVVQGNIDEVILGITQNITDTRASIDNNITDLKVELSLNFTTIRAEIESNSSVKIQNATDAALIYLNVTQMNVTNISVRPATIASKQVPAWIWNNGSHIFIG